MIILNMVIPILMQSAVLFQIVARCKPQATRHPTKCNVINDVKLFPTVYFDVIQSDVALQKQVH